MCNLYRMTRAVAEVAGLFWVRTPEITPNVPEEVYPGYLGLNVAGGEVRSMTWGFPLVLKGTRGYISPALFNGYERSAAVSEIDGLERSVQPVTLNPV